MRSEYILFGAIFGLGMGQSVMSLTCWEIGGVLCLPIGLALGGAIGLALGTRSAQRTKETAERGSVTVARRPDPGYVAAGIAALFVISGQCVLGVGPDDATLSFGEWLAAMPHPDFFGLFTHPILWFICYWSCQPIRPSGVCAEYGKPEPANDELAV